MVEVLLILTLMGIAKTTPKVMDKNALFAGGLILATAQIAPGHLTIVTHLSATLPVLSGHVLGSEVNQVRCEMKTLILLAALILPLQGCELIIQAPLELIVDHYSGSSYSKCINKYEGAELETCLDKKRKKITPMQAKIYECHAIPGIGDGTGDGLRACLKEAKE